ncbi:succinyltransferase-like protein [Pseudaminobacter salicylatoxidans]|uniref:Succinyltransferase-like protein n=2 Tax=Pseudaminobacter salicylatoxidans TaxID=93369 RepID=A0A316C0I5_PSESE|nr:succinyltransferase-like protein [Pseudaminobacter salicylatoxidans]
MIHHRALVHAKAHVDANTVQIGAGTKVWQFASVTRGTVLGDDCSVSPHAMLDGSIYGDRVIISGGVMAGAGFKVGNDVFLGPNVVLCNDAWPAVDKDGYDDERLRSKEWFTVTIGNGATIGAGAVILPGNRIYPDAVVAAGAIVNRNVPSGMVFCRGGSIKPKPEDWRENRMRWVS